MSKSAEMNREALTRAVTGQSMANYPAIFEGLMAKGIPEEDIDPRGNVFTYGAWQAAGRQVRKGEKGVRIQTWINGKKKDKATGREESVRFPRTTSVFHISQTDPIE